MKVHGLALALVLWSGVGCCPDDTEVKATTIETDTAQNRLDDLPTCGDASKRFAPMLCHQNDDKLIVECKKHCGSCNIELTEPVDEPGCERGKTAGTPTSPPQDFFLPKCDSKAKCGCHTFGGDDTEALKAAKRDEALPKENPSGSPEGGK